MVQVTGGVDSAEDFKCGTPEVHALPRLLFGDVILSGGAVGASDLTSPAVLMQ